MRRTDVHIEEILRDQDGVVTRRQAREAGLSPAQIAARLADRSWLPVAPAVFHSAQHPETDRARARAWALWLGPEATLIGAGAAWWLRMHDVAPTRFRFAVPTTRRFRPRDGVGVLRRHLAPHERMLVDGIHVTTRAVTVLDAVGELGLEAGSALMDRALLRGRTTVEALRRAHHEGLGRQGSPAAGRALALAAGGARFEAERRLHRQLRHAGVVGWQANVAVTLPGYGDAVLDLAFADQRVLVEVDGWAYHRDVDAFRRDRRRQNALVLAGWTIVRVTWHDLVTDPDRVIAWIRAALTVREAP